MGTMARRRVTYKVYPNKQQEELLENTRRMHCDLYNAALEERITAYRRRGISVKKADQEKSLTQIRQQDPLGYGAINAQALQGTLKRLDEAFQHFFRRVKEGREAPGFPRFKAGRRFKGWTYKAHGDGWRVFPGADWKHGRLRLSGIGTMQIRGKARTQGAPKTCTITKKIDGWYASVVIECQPRRDHDQDAHDAMTMDWGQETYATLVWGIEDDEYEELANERFWQSEKDKIIEKNRELSQAILDEYNALPKEEKKQWKKPSKRHRRKRRELARAHRRLSNRRKDRSHKTSAYIAKRCKRFGTEKLTVQNMTRSAKGSVENPGKNVRQKAGNNREALDTAPADLLKMIRYKVEETGADYIEIPTRQVKPSQRCPVAWTCEKKELGDRKHRLPDGRVIGRDHASGATQLRWMLAKSGQSIPWVGCRPLDSPGNSHPEP
ncbi:RNA-guided endonuclease InsQ/TnpB family protein [Salipiger mucosus]|uniref:Transposase n=1 Tax=Salipiger mucosus DSM 16094 TaxID=1123237 RepID=S9S3H0_9RHOB|nr:RNA-guided endonuclease TnpB family protein [Salipiger mucosus]EPX84745.1 hypothetical protein Salmuc_01318 [Salipiger mucosus DSM 16094]